MDASKEFWVVLGQCEGWFKLISQTINHSSSCGFAASVAAPSSRAGRLDTEVSWPYITQVCHGSPEPTTEQLRCVGSHVLPSQTGEDFGRLGRLVAAVTSAHSVQLHIKPVAFPLYLSCQLVAVLPVAQDWWESNGQRSKSCIVNRREAHYMLSYKCLCFLKMRKDPKNATVAFLLSWFCHGEGKQNPLKHGRRIWERRHKASKKYLLPFHSMLNTFALMAPHLQLSGSLCARSSSSQRSRLWPSCLSLLRTWA